MSSQKRRDKNKGQLESQIWILWNKLHHSAAPSRSCVFVCFKSKKERTGQRDQRMRLLIIVSPCKSTRSMKRRRRTRKENRRADLIEWERKKTSQRERPRDKQTQQADQEMGRKDIPFSRHHGDDPDLEDGDHGSGFASAANGCLSASYPLKVRTMSPYRTLGNDLI